MKISSEEIFAAVRMNDAVQDSTGDFARVAQELGVDMESASFAAMQRSRMIMMAKPEIPFSPEIAAVLGALWLDGFFAALHAIEQQGDLGT